MGYGTGMGPPANGGGGGGGKRLLGGEEELGMGKREQGRGRMGKRQTQNTT